MLPMRARSLPYRFDIMMTLISVMTLMSMMTLMIISYLAHVGSRESVVWVENVKGPVLLECVVVR